MSKILDDVLSVPTAWPRQPAPVGSIPVDNHLEYVAPGQRLLATPGLLDEKATASTSGGPKSGQTFNAAMSALSDDQASQLTHQSQSSSGPEGQGAAAIDSPTQFHLHQHNCVDFPRVALLSTYIYFIELN